MDASAPQTETSNAEAPVRPRRTYWQRNETWILGLVSMLVFLALWEIAVRAGLVKPLFTSSPSRIVTAAIEMFSDPTFYAHLEEIGRASCRERV